MLSIRLSRVGRKKAPTYRVVVMPKHQDPYGKVVEILGNYNPRTEPRTLVLKADRIKYWLSQGAQATDTVWNLLVDEKIVEGDKRTASHISKKRTAKMSEKEAEVKEKAEAAKVKKAEAAAAESETPAEKTKEETPKEEPKASASTEATADKEEKPA